MVTRDEWLRDVLEPACARSPERQPSFHTLSGYAIEPAYGPDGLTRAADSARRLSVAAGADAPESWSMSVASGHGSAADTNARFRELVAAGATGLTVHFDHPTSVGWDADDPRAAGGVGRGGVSVCSADDMWDLFEGVDLRRIRVTLAAHEVAPVLFAQLLVAAERSGLAWRDLRGALYHDLYSHRRGGPSIRLANDMFTFCSRHVPGWCVVTVGSGMRRAEGGTPQQELSAVMAAGIRCVEAATAAGTNVDEVAPLVSFRLRPHPDLFEEIARRRAARQVWARVMRERFGAQAEASVTMRVLSETAAEGAPDADPLENAVRTTYHALAAVLGGTTALQVDPAGTRAADTQILAIRGQQVLASESGLSGIVDPLGGSWWIERLTADIVERTLADLTQGELVHQSPEPGDETRPNRDEGNAQTAGLADRIKAYRAGREQPDVEAALATLQSVVRGRGNGMDALVGAARAGATLGEMWRVLTSASADAIESHVR